MPIDDSTTSGVRYLGIEGDPDYRIGDDGSSWTRKTGPRVGPKPRQIGEWKRLKGSVQYRGHHIVTLFLGGRRAYRFVHRLVLEAFVGPCPVGMECRHMDGDPGNNRLDNLRWGTRAENYADSVRHGTAAPLPATPGRPRTFFRPR